ncbi:hypothetical protein JRQ81_003248, partial [Phrynocephalus forsythii]
MQQPRLHISRHLLEGDLGLLPLNMVVVVDYGSGQQEVGRPTVSVHGLAYPTRWYICSLSRVYGPEHWVTLNADCGRTHQSPIDIVDHQARVGEEYQEIHLVGFDNESSNKTWMKNTGKTVAILLKDDYFISGAGLPGRFKAEKVEFHWGQSSGSAGSEHSINGRRFPVEMQIYFYNPDDFDSFGTAVQEKRIIGAMAVFFQ